MEAQTEVVEKKVPFAFPIDVYKSVEDGGEFHVLGYAATTDFDKQGDVLTAEALKAAAQDLLKNSTVLLNHDLKLPIGRVVAVKFDKRGLLIDALISSTEPEVIQKIKEGVLNKFSIRGQVLERERKFSKEHDRVINVIKRVSLVEASLVSVPANPEARAIGWYISKALENEGPEGGEDMDDVTVEPISDEQKPGAGGNPPALEGGQEAPAQGQAQPPAQSAGQAPAQEPPKPAQDAAAGQPSPPPRQEAPAPQEDKPAEGESQDELTKAMNVRLAGLMEPVYALLDKLIGQVDEKAKPLAQQIKAMLKAVAGQAYPYPYPYPAPGKAMGDMAAEVSAEVQKQVKKALDEIPTLRKGLAPGGQQAAAPDDEVLKAFEALDPSDKLRALLKVEHGRNQ